MKELRVIIAEALFKEVEGCEICADLDIIKSHFQNLKQDTVEIINTLNRHLDSSKEITYQVVCVYNVEIENDMVSCNIEVKRFYGGEFTNTARIYVEMTEFNEFEDTLYDKVQDTELEIWEENYAEIVSEYKEEQ